MKVLVTGAAGYIGAFMTKTLLDEGVDVIAVDSLERGKKDRVDIRARFERINLLNTDALDSIFSNSGVDGVIHFAGYISVGESMKNPYIYFKNNTHATVSLLEAMKKADISNIIFSSTAGVYGNPNYVPIPEDHPQKPESPYGESKHMVEKMLKWYATIYGINYAALRYFNAAGAALDGSLGEDHDPESHIIPLAIKAAIDQKDFTINGDNYNTHDGTCVRDYIHVIDLVQAHVLALEMLQKSGGEHVFNVGTGKGHTNREVVEAIKQVTGKEFSVSVGPRREGDPDELVADPSKIKKELNFSPKYSDLQTIVESAYKWHSSQQ